MALTAEITKVAVRQRMPKLWSISLLLVVSDGATPVLSRSFSQDHKQGHSIPDLADRFLKEMKAAIDEYQAEQAVFTDERLDTVVAALTGSVTTHLGG